ncbi:MAG: hydroxyacylglutathione hydrolase [Rhodocyclales bacterium]|nr:hydroxyacylglutathione hydrolase [Rhodocyclales bacterium]
MQIIPLPAFRDNYIWLLRDDRHAVVVDPGDAAPVLDYLEAEGLSLSAVLITHFHPDHTAGVGALLARHPAPVYGPRQEAIAGVSHPVGEGDEILCEGLGLRLQVLDVPGHTLGHVAYYAPGLLFCGDTLFGAGCGRILGSTPQALYASLQRIAALPGDTQVYCTHEYTLANLAFASAVEPDNAAVAKRVAACEAQRAAQVATVPFTLAGEFETNPFLRADQPQVRARAEQEAGTSLGAAEAVFTVLRDWKNRF